MVSEGPAWLGRPESATLEYKSSAALRHAETVVRAVVAMLNRSHGQVIVGVDDSGVPHGVEAADAARDQLQQRLMDAIEPRPMGRVDVVRQPVQELEVLVVKVKRARGANAPKLHAERRHGLYGFWIRAGATTRALSLHEVRERWGEAVAHHRTPWHGPLKDEGETVFVLQAETHQGLDVSALERVFHDAQRHRLTRRRMGFTVVSEDDRLERGKRGVRQVNAQGALRWLSFDTNRGLIRFEGRGFLFWKPHPAFPDERVIYPWPLVEGTASFFWLLQRYAEEAKPDDGATCQLGIWRPEGLRLGPYRPGNMRWDHPRGWLEAHDNTVIEHEGEVAWPDIGDNPDLVAHPFVAEVYEDFGYEPAVMPFWNAAELRFEL